MGIATAPSARIRGAGSVYAIGCARTAANYIAQTGTNCLMSVQSRKHAAIGYHVVFVGFCHKLHQFVFSTCTSALLQENPARVLAYKASSVHQYGWIPLNPFHWRNIKATVFSSALLNLQSAALCLWALLLHTTGFGVPVYDMRAFLKIWGTVYAGKRCSHQGLAVAANPASSATRVCLAGSVFNMATIVVFILGLFISLVINRWWSIRSARTPPYMTPRLQTEMPPRMHRWAAAGSNVSSHAFCEPTIHMHVKLIYGGPVQMRSWCQPAAT